MSRQVPEDLKAIATMMDSRFNFLGFRFGADGLLGLVPGVGDVSTNMVSLYIILRAAFLGVTPIVLLKMGGNVLLENLVGFVPIVGNVFDFVWRANLKNITLMEENFLDPVKSSRKAKFQAVFLCLGFLALFLTLPVLLVLFFYYLQSLIF